MQRGSEDFLPVHCPLDRTAHMVVIERREFGVELHAIEAKAGVLLIDQARVLLGILDIDRADVLRDVDVACLEVRVHHAFVGDGPVVDFVEIRKRVAVAVFLPVMWVALEREMISLDPTDELERPSASLDRIIGELAALRLDHGRREHHARAIGQVG